VMEFSSINLRRTKQLINLLNMTGTLFLPLICLLNLKYELKLKNYRKMNLITSL